MVFIAEGAQNLVPIWNAMSTLIMALLGGSWDVVPTHSWA